MARAPLCGTVGGPQFSTQAPEALLTTDETPTDGTAIDGAALDETIAYVAIRRVQNAYADIVMRRAWDELHTVMEPGCTLSLDLGDRSRELTGPDAIGEFIGGQLERFTFFECVILNTVVKIDLEGATAATRMYMQELRQDSSDGRRSNAFGVYHDSMRRDAAGRWRFARRRYGSYSRYAVEGPEHEQVTFELPVIQLDSI